MAQDAAASGPLPIVPFLIIPSDGDPYLEGHRCGQCQSVFIGERTTCSKCGTRDQMKAEALAQTGELYVFSIVHRSFPGVPVPHVSAVVDLDGGGTVKGNLIGIEPDPEKVKIGMPVELSYEVAPTRDREGNEYLTYYFKPRA